MTHHETCVHDFICISRHQLRERLRRIELCIDKLSDGQLWTRNHEKENAVGNLILHLAGNIRQWIVSGVGGETDARDRDSEFSRREPLDRGELILRLRQAIEQADRVLASVTTAQLARKRKIQVYEVTGLHAVYHAVEHFAEHTGQIIGNYVAGLTKTGPGTASAAPRVERVPTKDMTFTRKALAGLPDPLPEFL
ncbi:MAG: DUF1572 family protein, partial [Bryobacterales bacterium]|nr:DUF1572 family protein [Bryobacterales bacterium]